MKLIVGIDPGLNAGIACINIESGAAKTYTMRNASIGDMCDYLSGQGEPIVVASDVKHVPRTVKKIAAAFNARLFYSQLSVKEKRQTTKNINYNNIHERDALAAAISAKKFFSPMFEKIDNVLERKGFAHLNTSIKELLIKRQAGNIESAIRKLMPIKVEKKRRIRIEVPKPVIIKESSFLESKLLEKDNEIAELKKDIAILRSKNMDKTIETMRKVMDGLRKTINEKDRELASLKNLLTEGFEIIMPFKENEDMKDKIVLAEGSTKMLGNTKPRAIISEERFPANAPVIKKADIDLIRIDNLIVAEKKKLEDLIEKESFLQYLEKYKHRYEKAR